MNVRMNYEDGEIIIDPFENFDCKIIEQKIYTDKDDEKIVFEFKDMTVIIQVKKKEE